MTVPEPERRRRFARALPQLVERAVERWSLELGARIEEGETGSYVARARTADGLPAVLKIGWPHDEARHEADGLRAFAGNGAVRLLAAAHEGETDVLLLEACVPGNSLARSLPPLEQDVVLATLLPRLWIEPPFVHPFRPLAAMCARWVDLFEERACEPALDPGIVRTGLELFRRLPELPVRSVLVATDVHPDNILAAEREAWLMIDPKPYVGDPAYDALQYMLNFPARLEADAAGFANRLAQLLELDAAHLRQWLLARCVIESVEWPLLGRVAGTLARSGH